MTFPESLSPGLFPRLLPRLTPRLALPRVKSSSLSSKSKISPPCLRTPSPDRSPNPRLHRRTLNLAAFSGFRRGLRGSVPRRQHFGDPRTASQENKTESSAGGLPSARVSGTAPPRLVLPAPGGCDAAGSAVTASAPPRPVAARAPRARRDPGADGPKTGTAGPGAR